ncbi:MAG: hypothetical protein ACQET5_15135, partial [Halobacteriota archaeon]
MLEVVLRLLAGLRLILGVGAGEVSLGQARRHERLRFAVKPDVLPAGRPVVAGRELPGLPGLDVDDRLLRDLRLERVLVRGPLVVPIAQIRVNRVRVVFQDDVAGLALVEELEGKPPDRIRRGFVDLPAPGRPFGHGVLPAGFDQSLSVLDGER